VALNPTAHSLYPLRIRILNAETGAAEWHNVAYIPVIRKGKEPGADLRAKRRRAAILQRVLYLVFRSAIAASHVGVKVRLGNRDLLCFPRLLLYICDLPEEKAVLCLTSGTCAKPCSICDVDVQLAGAPEALNSEERDARKCLDRQVEATNLRIEQKSPRRRLQLEKHDSAHSIMPAIAGLAGLSTEPFLLYKMIGVDTLHVSSQRARSSLLFVSLSSSFPGALVGVTWCLYSLDYSYQSSYRALACCCHLRSVYPCVFSPPAGA